MNKPKHNLGDEVNFSLRMFAQEDKNLSINTSLKGIVCKISYDPAAQSNRGIQYYYTIQSNGGFVNRAEYQISEV